MAAPVPASRLNFSSLSGESHIPPPPNRRLPLGSYTPAPQLTSAAVHLPGTAGQANDARAPSSTPDASSSAAAAENRALSPVGHSLPADVSSPDAVVDGTVSPAMSTSPVLPALHLGTSSAPVNVTNTSVTRSIGMVLAAGSTPSVSPAVAPAVASCVTPAGTTTVVRSTPPGADVADPPPSSSIAHPTSTRPRRVVLPELALIGSDKFCSEIIINMRSAGRMLLANLVVFLEFERVSLVLSTSSDPTKLVILDCAEDARSRAEQVAFGSALASRMVLPGNARCPGSARAGRPRPHTLPLRKPAKSSGRSSQQGPDHSASGAGHAADAETKSDAGSDDAHTAANDGGDADASGREGPDSQRTRVDDDAAPTSGPEADTRALLEAHSLSEALINNGPMESDDQGAHETVTSGMVDRFLQWSGLPDVGAPSLTMFFDLWKVAGEMRGEMVASSGAPRDWRSLCPREHFLRNWATAWETPQTSPVADRVCLFFTSPQGFGAPLRAGAFPWSLPLPGACFGAWLCGGTLWTTPTWHQPTRAKPMKTWKATLEIRHGQGLTQT